jgi:hypothetical protein
MKKNMGSVDRVVRILVAILVLVLYLTHAISGTLAIVLGILSLVFIATAVVGTCPLYLPFGISTKKKEQ